MRQDVLSLLVQYFGDYEQHGHDYYFYCPNRCHKFKKKLSVDLEKEKYHCWICGYGGSNLYWLFMKFFPENKTLWKKVFPSDEDILWEEKKQEKNSESDEEYRRYLMKSEIEEYSLLLCDYWKKLPSEISGYLEKKRITRENAFLWNMRLHPNFNDRILVPSLDINCEFNYYSIRLLGDNVFSKFFRPRVKFDIFNFFWIKDSRVIYLVENVFDATRFPISNVVPILGSEIFSLGDIKNHCLKNHVEVRIFLDPDAMEKSIKINKFFREHGVSSYIVKNENMKKIEDMDDEEFYICINSVFDHSEILRLQVMLFQS